MPALPTDLRRDLERVVIEARDVAEAGARAALEALAVHHYEPYKHMAPDQRTLRNHLRARARQLGDRQDRSGRLQIDHLAGECAYEHWHRMLFARFLADSGLLIEPQMGVAISLEEAEELANEEGIDVWVFASRCAQDMLPQIFRPDDPLLQVSFATEHRVKLERLLDSLPPAVFTASDALGWVYQFWQSKRKDEVNRSEVKIGADELPAVTQLFTEPYMVEFLLHNTLGAWWAGKRLTAEDAENAETEEELRKKLALPGVEWEYLRFVKVEAASSRLQQERLQQERLEQEQDTRQDAASTWRPAAGTFDGWPRQAKDIKMLDPCCGSGHFLVAALHHLVPIRMAEEGLSAREAVDAVLRDNLHGLEIDERCCQIAAFALALAAWKTSGWKPLPPLNIACSGIGPQCTEEEWIALAQQSGIPMPVLGREPIKEGLRNLHRLFSQAPTLGSLIDPTELPSDMFAADYETIQPYLVAIMSAEKADDETRERAIAAAGMVKAAELLAGEYTLVITNVPYLGRGKQDDLLKACIEKHHPAAKQDLATAFVERCLAVCQSGSGILPLGSSSNAARCRVYGTAAMVTPQNWLFLTSYKKLRQNLLKQQSWNMVVRLGPGAFETISGHVVNVALFILSATPPPSDQTMAGIDVSAPRGQRPIYAAEKAALLRGEEPTPIALIEQKDQLKNPDAVVLTVKSQHGRLLSDFADVVEGLSTGDNDRFVRRVWELRRPSGLWALHQGPPVNTTRFGGRESAVCWEDGKGDLSKSDGARIQGYGAWGRDGVIVGQMSQLKCALYTGEIHNKITGAIVPRQARLLPAIWAFCESPEYDEAVRRINTKLNVATATLTKVPFDLAHWQKVAAEKYPDGLPEPESDDPTQWLFHGYPGGKVEAASRRLEDTRQDAAAEDTRQDAASTFGFLDRQAEIENLSGNLPHWRQPGVTYFVTFRTDDSIPQEKLRQWLAEREAWLKAHPLPHNEATRREYGRRFTSRFHKWLDAGYGACVLARPECREIVEAALRYFHGQRYTLDEFVVMPNHVHVIVTPLPGHELSNILHSWKSYTSKQINKRLGQSGTFWQKESFDHILRSPEQLAKVRQYIRDNPKRKVEAASRRLDQDTRQDAASTLQVAVARLLGYRWPAELDEKMRLSERARALVKRCEELLRFADEDGIVCIPSVRGEEAAAERLRRLLAAAFGDAWSARRQRELIAATGSKETTLDGWLRNDFFEQHCGLFHHRPFIWHIWDGRRRDGFHALVNYHKLCGSGFQPLAEKVEAASSRLKERTRQDAASTSGRKLLESLTYSYLGDWITRQKDGVKRGEGGAEDRLAAALELQKRLEAILEGEPPFDIFVRWKPLSEQPIGWEPDINDGVRLNIRPLLASDLPKAVCRDARKGAGVLRWKPNIKWKKDRGKEPERPKEEFPWFWGWDEKTEDFLGGATFDGNRWNGLHYTNKAKQAAREAAENAKPRPERTSP